MMRRKTAYTVVILFLLTLLGGLVFMYLTQVRPAEKAEAFSGPGFSFIKAIYGIGPDPDQLFQGPFGVAWANGELYVTDTQLGGVYVLTRNGDFVRQIGKHGRAPGEVFAPLGVAVGPQGQVVVADRAHAKAVVYSKDGTYLQELKAELPLIPFFSGERLYLTVGGGVDLFDGTSYEKLAEWGERGKAEEDYDFPNGIGRTSEGVLVISDGNNMRVKGVNADGEVQWMLGKPPTAVNDTQRLWGLPGGVAVAGDIIYMTDPLNGVIHLVSTDGKYLAEVGEAGEGEGSFMYPAQIAHLDGNQFAVTEWGNSRISIIEINPDAAIRAWEESGGAPAEESSVESTSTDTTGGQ